MQIVNPTSPDAASSLTHEAWMSPLAILAQTGGPDPLFNQANPGATPATGAGTTAAPAGGPPAAGGPSPGNPMNFMLPVFLVVGGLLIFQIFKARKVDKQRREMLGGMKKYDRVLTIGGLIGTVAELRDDEVVLKVDEHSSTKIRFTRSAIQQVLRTPEGGADKAEVIETKSKGEGVGAKG